MIEADKDQFSETLGGIAGFYEVDLPIASTAIYWSALLEYGIRDIREAIAAHIKDPEHGRFMPKPADIIRHLPAGQSTVMGADAAWEIAMQLGIGHEDATVIAPAAILTAFPHALWRAGDKVAARMAFKDKFPAALVTHGMGYTVSEGCEPEGREPAIMEAVRRNLIPSMVAQRLLPHMAREIAALKASANNPLLAKGDANK